MVRPVPEGTRPRRGPCEWLRSEVPRAGADASPEPLCAPIPLAYRVFEEFFEEGREAARSWTRPLGSGLGSERAVEGTSRDPLRVLIETLDQLNGWSRMLQGVLGPAVSRGPTRWPTSGRTRRPDDDERHREDQFSRADDPGETRIFDPYESKPPFDPRRP